MPVLTEPFGRRRLDVADDRIALYRPGMAGLVLRHDDGHVLALSYDGKWLRQSGTFAGRPGRLPVKGFDGAELRRACLAEGWDWTARGTVTTGTRPSARAERPSHSMVSRRWSLVPQAAWPHVRHWLLFDATAIALLAGLGWAATWAMARLNWLDRPARAETVTGFVVVLAVLSLVRAFRNYRRGGKDDWVRVSDEEVVWRSPEASAFVAREQVETVVEADETLRFAGTDGDVAHLGVPPGQTDVKDALEKHGWVVRGE